MSITDEKAVLIIGAGTSLQFGLPSGNELFDLIRDQINAETEIDTRSEFLGISDAIVNFGNHQGSFRSTPILGATLLHHTRTMLLPPNERLNRILTNAHQLKKRLANQTSETIDDFIYQNPDLSGITKVAVATIIFKKLYKADERQKIFNLKQLDSRFFEHEALNSGSETLVRPAERNWIHLLINLVREGVRTDAVSPTNKVKIISLNYDMVLEHVLDQQFTNTYAEAFSSDASWKDYIEVAHVHGKFDGLSKSVSNPYDLILNWANSLSVIHENMCSSSVEAERVKAKQIMQASNKIYATGFAFSTSNVEMLEIFKPHQDRGGVQVRYSNFDGDYGLTMAMKSFETERQMFKADTGGHYGHSVSVFESTGSDTRKMSTVNWFYSGVPGRLPS